MRARRCEQRRNFRVHNELGGITARWATVGRVLLAVALLMICTPTTTFAKPSDTVRQFASAQKVYDSGDFAAALPLFQRVLDNSSSPNARLYVARCLRELGRLPEAFEQMDITQHDAATRAQTEPKYAQTRDAAAAERALLESRIGRLIIAVASPPSDMQVTLNDESLSSERLRSAIAVKPGTLTLKVEAPGMTKVQRSIAITAGEAKTVALTLQPLDGSKSESKLETPEPSASPVQTGGSVRTVGVIIAGLGVASLATAGISWLVSDQKFRGAAGECGTPCTQEKLSGIQDTVNTLDTIATATLIGGIAGATAGAVMILIGGPSVAPTTTATVSVSPNSAMIGCTGIF